LEFLESSQATGAHSSPRLCGPACAHSSTYLTHKPLPTILSLTASWSASIAALRMHCAQGRQEQIGFLTCH
jgi:hypothetical protein